MPVTYYFGCWWLPAFLSILDFDFVKLGDEGEQQDHAQEQPLEGKAVDVPHPEPTDIPRLSAQEDTDNGKSPSLLEDVTSEIEC